MTLVWFLILLVWGIREGFSSVPVVAWLLLIPFAWRALGQAIDNK